MEVQPKSKCCQAIMWSKDIRNVLHDSHIRNQILVWCSSCGQLIDANGNGTFLFLQDIGNVDRSADDLNHKDTLYTGNTIRTFTGKYIDVFNPDPAQIDIEDIAHSLSHECRFGGHTWSFYSVGLHSIACAELIMFMAGDQWCKKADLGCQTTDDMLKLLLTTLLHDSTEAYLKDLPKPIKKRIPQYKAIEENLMRVIAQKFDLIYPFPDVVKQVDKVRLEIEHRVLMLKNTTEPNTGFYPFGPERVKKIFLDYFNSWSKQPGAKPFTEI